MNKTRNTELWFKTLVMLVISAATAAAGVPRLIDYQGKLRDASGVAVNGSIDLRFRLYDADTAGNELFDETHTGVSMVNGVFHVLIGSQWGEVPDSVIDEGDVWLGVTVGTGSELSPRTRLVSTPYTLKAQSAEQLVDPNAGNLAVFVEGTTGNVGIGAVSPGAKLEVGGQVKITGGSPGADRILTSDASGLARWESPPVPPSSIPSGFVGFFNLTSCPQGWTELTAARGRYPVALPAGGTLEGTSGTALTNLEARPVGQHTHTGTVSPHSHSLNEGHGQGSYHPNAAYVHWPTQQNSNYWPASYSTGDASPGVSLNDAGSVAGTNAPYIQLLCCEKD